MPVMQRVAERAVAGAPPPVGLSPTALAQEELVHDLRKELAVVRHLVDALQCSVPLRPDLTRLLSDLADEVAVLDDLVLSSARPATWGAVDLGSVAHGVVRGVQAVHRGRVQLRCAAVPPVHAPAVLLRRAVANLVVNACDAARHAQVAVSVAAEGDVVILDVDDDAAFADPEHDRLGLGTWIVHAVVRDCGGSVERSRSPLGGRRVRLRLPAMPPAPA